MVKYHNRVKYTSNDHIVLVFFLSHPYLRTAVLVAISQPFKSTGFFPSFCLSYLQQMDLISHLNQHAVKAPHDSDMMYTTRVALQQLTHVFSLNKQVIRDTWNTPKTSLLFKP